jgi:hypothetical protein
MVYFQTKNPNLGKILEGLRIDNIGKFYAHLEYAMSIWYTLWSIGNFVEIWCIFDRFGTLCVEKSGSPAPMHFNDRWLIRGARTYSAKVKPSSLNFSRT